VRRLRDYSNMPFELVVALLTVGALALLTYHVRPWQGGASPPSLTRVCAFTALAIYLQLGGLLVKQGLVKWRMWLPGERTEDYLRWREAVLHYFLFWCDYLRGAITAAPVLWVLALHFREVWHRRAIWPLALAAAGVLILFGWVGLRRQGRRLTATWNELQP